MRKIKNIIAIVFGAPLLIIPNVLGFLAYFVRKTDQTGILVDGLGRELFITPAFIRLFLHPDSLWAGFFWLIADTIIYFGSMGLGIFVIYLLYSDKETAE